jgi:hypothetical protein
MCEFVRQYQNLLVGGIGFAGVIVTLIVNARLARRQHERQVEHERTLVRVALRAELKAVAEAYRDRISTLDDPGPYYCIQLSLDTMTDVYRSVIGRIGLLSDQETPLVLRAYLLAQQLPERVRMLPTAKPGEPGFVWVGAQSFGALKQMHLNYLEDIDKAIAAIRS